MVIDLKARQGNKAEDMTKKWKDLTSEEKIQGLLAFSESDCLPCTEEEFQEWIISYHRERLNPEASKLVMHPIPDYVKQMFGRCDSPNTENK